MKWFIQKETYISDKVRIYGNVECDTARVSGNFSGTLVAKRWIEVKVPSVIVGDLISDSIRIDSGVAVQGKILAKIVQPDYAPTINTKGSDKILATEVGE